MNISVWRAKGVLEMKKKSALPFAGFAICIATLILCGIGVLDGEFQMLAPIWVLGVLALPAIIIYAVLRT